MEIRKREQDGLGSQLDQRAAALESQQAILATLRTGGWNGRCEESRRQEQSLSDQRCMQEAAEADLKQRPRSRSPAARRAGQRSPPHRAGADPSSPISRITLDAAVAQMRTAQETLAAEQAALAERQQQFDLVAAEQADQADRLLSRGAQLEEMHTRLAADRQALREREGHSDQVRAGGAAAPGNSCAGAAMNSPSSRLHLLEPPKARLADETHLPRARAGTLAQEQGAIGLELEQRRQGLASQTTRAGPTQPRDLLAREEALPPRGRSTRRDRPRH